MRRFAAPLVLVIVCAGGTAWSASPDEQLERGALAYARGDYREAIQLLRPLLYPTIQLSDEDKALRAHKLLGISYVFEKDLDAARNEFMAILGTRPDFELDPLVEPVAAVELFEQVKRDNAEKLAEVRRRIEAQRRRQAQEVQPPRVRETVLLERTTTRRSYWVNFVPFGVPQFQNGHRTKGYVLMASQIALGAVSLGAAIWQRAAFSGPLREGSEDETVARRLVVTQVVSGALFFAAVAYGIFDGLAYFEAETVEERRSPAAEGEVSLLPVVTPQGAGIGLALTF